MAGRRPSPLLLILSLAMFAGVAWATLSFGFQRLSIGGERWGFRTLLYGVSFERYARGVAPQWPSSFVNPLSVRGRWGLQYDTFMVRGARSDRLYVSFPWLVACAALPAAIWLVLLLRQPRRRVAGVCPGCEYDIRATPGRCPECGMALRPPSLRDRALALDAPGVWRRLRRGSAQAPTTAPAGRSAPPSAGGEASPIPTKPAP